MTDVVFEASRGAAHGAVRGAPCRQVARRGRPVATARSRSAGTASAPQGGALSRFARAAAPPGRHWPGAGQSASARVKKSTADLWAAVLSSLVAAWPIAGATAGTGASAPAVGSILNAGREVN